MAKTRIHVNGHRIRANAKHGTCEPVITVRRGRRTAYARSVAIDGPATVVYQPDKPLSCGAKVWIETEAAVRVIE